MNNQPIEGMVSTTDGRYAVMVDPKNGHYGWVFVKHPDGIWISSREASLAEMKAAQYQQRLGVAMDRFDRFFVGTAQPTAVSVPTCKTPIGTACPGDGVGPCKKCQVTKPQHEPVIAGGVLDSYDYAIADLDPESACTYVSNGELAQLVAAVRTLQARYLTQPEPDSVLCGFYSVTDYPGLVRELVGHVAQLQELAKRNVKPWEDTFPPTLLPAHVARVNAANEALQRQNAPVAIEPILVEAVAVTRMCPQDGLCLDWLIEGGIAALEQPGTVLLVAQGTLTNDSGNGYVYPARNPEDDE